MRMRLLYLVSVASAVLGGVLPPVFGDEAFDPKPYGLARYEHIWVQSPFVVETPIVQTSTGLEQRFALTAIATINSTPVVFLLDRKSLTRLMVASGAKDNPQNIQLVSVAPNTDPKLASATIRLGAEQGTVRYDSAGLQAATEPAKSTASADASKKGDTQSNQATSGTTATAPVSVRILRRSPINLNH